MSWAMGAKTEWIDGAAALVGECAVGEGMEGGWVLKAGRLTIFYLCRVYAFYEPVLAGMAQQLPGLPVNNAVLTLQEK